jgi:hypothetical protein
VGRVPRTHARFAEVPAGKGHYESFYLKACHPSEPLGVWIRYTVHKHSNQPPQGSIWFTLFDGAAPGPLASKVTTHELSAPDDAYIRIGDSTFGEGRVEGRAPTEQLNASWELTFDSDQEPLLHLPRDWMYRAPVPKTKLLTPYPGARFSGIVRAGERELALDGWPGMVGHNWGTQHAERWIWLHGAAFDGAEDAWFDAAIGRIKLGLVTTPWIANGTLYLDGERHRLGGPEKARRTKVSESAARVDFSLPGSGMTVAGRVESERKNFVGWVYADPDGPEHNTVNCSIADMTLTVRPDTGSQRELRLRGGAAYELGMREKDHGMPLQPFPDG